MTRSAIGKSCLAAAAAGVLLFLSVLPARAEIVEEIVAKVNDDIITKSDLESEEQSALQELYQRYSGTELDKQVKEAKEDLLRNLIDRKILLQRAPHLFDMSKMGDFFLQSFREQQNIKSDRDLEKLLAKEGMTLDQWKKKLVEAFAPQQVLRSEVVDRVAVPEKDVRAYYDEHSAEFLVPAQATVREIVVKADDSDREAKRSEAETLQAQASAPGADFAALAEAHSDAGTKAKGGLLGTVKKGDLAGPLDHEAFSIPVGSVSPVIDASYGFHILKVDARTDEHETPFADVQDDIEKKLRSEAIRKATRVYLKKAWAETTVWISPKYKSRLSPATDVDLDTP